MTSDFQIRFRHELLTAISRPPRRRRLGRRRLLAAGAAVAGALAIAAASLFGPTTANADVRITRGDGRIEVLLADVESSADDVQRAVTEAGLDVIVEPAPVGPSNVGQFVGNTTTGPGLDDLQLVDADGGSFMGFSIPEDWTGTLTIYVGRPATAGEGYTIFSDAFATGEPLAGSCALGQPLRAAAGVIGDLDVTVRSAPGRVRANLAEALDTEQADWDIASAYALSDTKLLVTVSPTPVAGGSESC